LAKKVGEKRLKPPRSYEVLGERPDGAMYSNYKYYTELSEEPDFSAFRGPDEENPGKKEFRASKGANT
jgi:hypothetical protein